METACQTKKGPAISAMYMSARSQKRIAAYAIIRRTDILLERAWKGASARSQKSIAAYAIIRRTDFFTRESLERRERALTETHRRICDHRKNRFFY